MLFAVIPVAFRIIIHAAQVIVVIHIAIFRRKNDTAGSFFVAVSLADSHDIAVVSDTVSFAILRFPLGFQTDRAAQRNDIPGRWSSFFTIDDISIVGNERHIAIHRFQNGRVNDVPAGSMKSNVFPSIQVVRQVLQPIGCRERNITPGFDVFGIVETAMRSRNFYIARSNIFSIKLRRSIRQRIKVIVVGDISTVRNEANCTI